MCVTCVVLCSYPELLGPHRGGDQLSEEVVEDGGRGGGFGEPAVHGCGGIRQEAGLAVPALEKGAGDQLSQPLCIRGRGSDHRYAKTVLPEDPELGIVENNSTANSMSGQGTVCYNPHRMLGKGWPEATCACTRMS